jgi:predicted dehydrogenase
MDQKKARVGFIGAGGIARSHIFSLNSLKYYYTDVPDVELAAVCSATEKSRSVFAARYGFERACTIDEFIADDSIDTVFILGPNNVHFGHLKAAAAMKSVKRIYLEKPVCSGSEQERDMEKLVSEYQGIKIQVGFQYLFSASVREALAFWRSGVLGRPVHFELKYYHSDYLRKDYRDKRVTRLTPAPDGGAMADLGSHAVSMLIAFLGNRLRISGAIQAGTFADVTDGSDLFSLITIFDEASGAAGTLASSRISSGTGDSLSLELFAEKGALKYSSDTADYFEYFTEESGVWTRKMVGSNFRPVTSFPSGHVPGGWLRAMVHAHYVFMNDGAEEVFIPDIRHGLDVQRIVTETADHLRVFREKFRNG